MVHQAVYKRRRLVLDPFVGSGTTCSVAYSLGRNSVGIDIHPHYIELAEENTYPDEMVAFEERTRYEP
jgi:DNA modification methylase